MNTFHRSIDTIGNLIRIEVKNTNGERINRVSFSIDSEWSPGTVEGLVDFIRAHSSPGSDPVATFMGCVDWNTMEQVLEGLISEKPPAGLPKLTNKDVLKVAEFLQENGALKELHAALIDQVKGKMILDELRK